MQAQGTKMDGGYMGKEKVAGKGNLFTTMGKVLLVMYIPVSYTHLGELLVGLVLSRKELYPGLAGLIRLVVQKINMYYNVQIVSGFERYLDLNPVVEVTAWLLVILSILQIYFLVVRKRLAGVLIPPLLLIRCV